MDHQIENIKQLANQKQSLLKYTEDFVRSQLESKACGHDFWHIHRVRVLALRIGKEIQADLFIVEMAAFLHDIADPKLHPTPEIGLKLLAEFLGHCENSYSVFSKELREKIENILACISFSSELHAARSLPKSLELQAVQDADRLDALGAIGIARTFAYGGSREQAMHDPALLPRENLDQKSYREGKSSSINHFYEKLFKLKSTLNTEIGKKIAADRHRYMENFIEQFLSEWDGKV